MNLKEFEGEALFVKYGIPVPRSFLVEKRNRNAGRIDKFLKDNRITGVVLKAQLKSGKRGKAGGIVSAGKSDIKRKIGLLWKKKINNEKPGEILIAEKIDIKKEYYLGIAADRFTRCPVLIFSRSGGMDIEDIKKDDPGKIFKMVISGVDDFPKKKILDVLVKAKCPKKELTAITGIAGRLFEMFIKEDCILAEINPLVFDRTGDVLAADAKVVIDDESQYRHPEWNKKFARSLSALEKKAHNSGLAYVELDGDIAIIGNGAGLVMTTLDLVAAAGKKPANFCDVGGGASAMMMGEALDIVLQKKSVKKLLINIFGGITRCDEVAKGLVDYLGHNKVMVPILVRMTGTNELEAINLLKESGIIAMSSVEEVLKEI